MGDLIARVPADLFWAVVVGYLLGAATVWRFASYVERMRDSVRHGKHHWERSVQFWRDARNNVAGLVAATGIVVVAVTLIGSLVWARVTAG